MTRARAATLHDVARRVGVGKTTASDALSGTGRVSPDTRAAVLAAAEELGYVPNQAARRLRKSTTETIALYLPETPTRSQFYMLFVFGVLERMAPSEYDVTVVFGGSGRRRVPRADGLIVSDPLAGDPFARRLLDAGLPVVSAEHAVDGPDPGGVVWTPHDAAVRELLDHLASAGAQRPALLVPAAGTDWAARIRRGFDDWCASRGIDGPVRDVNFVPTTPELAATVGDLLREHPETDAVVCAPTEGAAMMLPALRELGRRPGENLLLANCTDSTTLQLTDPSITALDTLPRELGSRCAELLLDVMAGRADPHTEVEMPYRLMPRASTRRLAR
ncbi:LacI family DNA-binding transcriptional regulator [Cryptosporangium aurantiacum]|uniref:LacI family DNA-binding transcriptional regulator n=1 Tax=Cryptosporangium aurantiacum TaxID=134849 RepID=UPI0015BCAEA4|nr:LacI family DNA-binding transcriptional regulator [Cryptosporangium aurantiacum]